LSDLDQYAHELDRSRTYLIEKAVSAYFDTLDEIISDKRIDDIKSGKSEVVLLADVLKRAGINV
jgi:predicted transcriptional regulator